MQIKIQPVTSTFNANTTGRSAVAAAYQRRNQLVGEPPPASRTDLPGPGFSSANTTAPGSLKGSSQQIVKPVETIKPPGPKPRMVPAAFKPIAPAVPPVPTTTKTGDAAMKQFFPGEDEEPESTPLQPEPEVKGGGKGFGFIPAKSTGRGKSPSGSKRPSRRMSSPMQQSRPSTANSPNPPVSHRATQDTLVQQRQSSPRSEERVSNGMAQEPTVRQPLPTEVYQLVNQVGEGTFGKVYKARNVLTGALVALKRIKVEAEKDGFPVTALREIKLLQSLSNTNVVSLREMMVSKGMAKPHKTTPPKLIFSLRKHLHGLRIP